MKSSCLVLLTLTVTMSSADKVWMDKNGMRGKLAEMGNMGRAAMTMISTLNNVSYYMAQSETDACDSASPDKILMGNPMMMGCMDDSISGTDPVCFCVKPPQQMIDLMTPDDKVNSSINEVSGFMTVCGMCRDPCARKWMPDMGHGDMIGDLVKKIHSMGMGGRGNGSHMMGGGNGAPMDSMTPIGLPPPPPPVPRFVEALIKTAMDILQKQDESNNNSTTK